MYMQNKRNDFYNLFPLCWLIPNFNGLVQSPQTIDTVQTGSRRYMTKEITCVKSWISFPQWPKCWFYLSHPQKIIVATFQDQ